MSYYLYSSGKVRGELPARFSREVVTINLPGLDMNITVYTGGLEADEMVRAGSWEQFVTQRMIDNIKPAMACVDVGAHVGYYTVLMSRLVGKNGWVYAFEPSEEMLHLLITNLIQNECHNVSIFPFALSGQQGDIEIREGADILDFRKRSTFSLPLDEISTRDVKFIKIDTDGREVDVLRGARRKLAHSPVMMSIEWSQKDLAEFGYTTQDLYDELCYQDFKILRNKRRIPVKTLLGDFPDRVFNPWCEK